MASFPDRIERTIRPLIQIARIRHSDRFDVRRDACFGDLLSRDVQQVRRQTCQEAAIATRGEPYRVPAGPVADVQYPTEVRQMRRQRMTRHRELDGPIFGVAQA